MQFHEESYLERILEARVRQRKVEGYRRLSPPPTPASGDGSVSAAGAIPGADDESDLLDPAGVVIQSLRRECRMSTEELAEAVGISSRSVERQESGDTRSEDIRPSFSEKLGRKIVLR